MELLAATPTREESEVQLSRVLWRGHLPPGTTHPHRFLSREDVFFDDVLRAPHLLTHPIEMALAFSGP